MTFQNNLLQINNTDQVINSLVDFIKKQVYENFKKKRKIQKLKHFIKK